MSNKLDAVLNLQPKVATLPLKDVKISLTDETPFAQIQGIGTAVLDPQARKDIIEMSGLDYKSIQRIRETSGTKTANVVLGQATKALGNKKLSFAFDGPRITRVVDPGRKALALSNKQVVGIAEMLVGKGLDVWGVQVSPDGTGAKIQIINPQVHDHPTMKNEAVTIGKSLNWDALGGTTLNEFVQRMFCSNGAITKEDGRGLGVIWADSDPAKLYESLFVKEDDKDLNRYWEKVQFLQETLMSVKEWNELKKFLDWFRKDSDVFKQHFGFDLQNVTWEKDYKKRGINLEEITQQKQRNCPTPVCWWDGINCLTWLASHDTKTGVGEWEKGKAMVQAGKFFGKSQYDSEAWMTGLPSWN